jgi:hypothetical protein
LIKHKRGIHERVTGFHDCPFHGIGRLGACPDYRGLGDVAQT